MSELELGGGNSIAGDQCLVKLESSASKSELTLCDRYQLRINQLEQALEQSLTSLSELKLTLGNQHLLETQLVATEEIANLQKHAINELQRQLAVKQSVTAQVKIEALETKLARQHTGQAQLQQAYQETEVQRDHYCSRLNELEQESILLQEKLLQQATQASEYETAVQYWKELYQAQQEQLLEIKIVLERQLPEPTGGILNLIKAIQLSLTVNPLGCIANKSLLYPLKKQPIPVDLPAFLTNR